jgi:hypothetical protein
MIKFLKMSQFTKGLVPVTSTDFYTRTGEFHQEGLISEKIFGTEGSSNRRNKYSFINLNAYVVHPSAYKILIQLDRRIIKFISTETQFGLDKEGQLIEVDNGVTGISEFTKLCPRIKWRGGSPDREKFIEVIYKAYEDGTLFLNEIPVIPPDLRPISKDSDGNIMSDPLNEYYVSILRRAFQVKSAGSKGPLFDLLNYGLQKAVIAHDDFIRTKISKKFGVIRDQLLSKRVDFSGRAVITPGPNLKAHEIGLPLKLAVNIFKPFVIHQLLYAKRVDQKKLEKEVKSFTKSELSVDSIERIVKSIKSGDIIPQSLRDIFFEATEVAMMGKIVLVKRDPNLHRENIRAVTPILIEGETIQICALEVGNFNADFDGDSSDCFIKYNINNDEKIIHISEFENNGLFEKYETKVKDFGIQIDKFRTNEKMTIKAIDPKTGEIADKLITEFSVHYGIEMYKIHDDKNRFKDFWASYDHSLIVYDEYKKEIIKISPRELLENPGGKYLIRREKNSSEQRRETCIKKYGVTHPSKLESIKNKKKETAIKNYGSLKAAFYDTMTKTIQKEHGVDNVSKLDSVKEKKIKTCRKNFECDHPMQSKKIRDKSKETLKKYGDDVENISQVLEIKMQKSETCIENYGVDNPSKCPEIIEKIRITTLKNYGVNNYSQLESVKEGKRLEMINGKASYMSSFIQNPSRPQVELFNLIKELYPSAELNYAIFNLNYNIDVAIPDLKIAIEYDGYYWHQDEEKDLNRQNKCEDLGWKFIRYKGIKGKDIVPTKDQIQEDIRRLI